MWDHIVLPATRQMYAILTPLLRRIAAVLIYPPQKDGRLS